MRFHLVDRIDEFSPFVYAIGTKCISLSEDCFDEHFPGHPVYPGSLLIETMAQLGGALLELSLRDTLAYFPRCAVSKVTAKFRDFARPGDCLTLRADVVSHHEQSAMVRATGSRQDKRICEAELLYVYLRVDDAELQRSREVFLDVVTRTARKVEDGAETPEVR